MCYINAPILWLIVPLCLSTGSLSKLRERSFASRLLFDTAFWMVSGCAIPGISLFLRHFHPSAKKNHPLAILSHNSVGACSTDSTCNVSVAKSYCRAGEGITNNLPARECLYPPAVPWDRAAFPLSCNCDTRLITLFIWKIKSYHALKASPFLLLIFLWHVCGEARAQPCGSRAWPAAQQQGCLPHIALGSALPLLGEKLGLVKMFSAAGRCSSMLHARWSVILDLCPHCRRRRCCKQEDSTAHTGWSGPAVQGPSKYPSASVQGPNELWILNNQTKICLKHTTLRDTRNHLKYMHAVPWEFAHALT